MNTRWRHSTSLEQILPWLELAGGVVMIGFGIMMITYRFHMASSFIYK